MKKLTLKNNGTVWLDLKSVSAVRLIAPDVRIFVGNTYFDVCSNDTPAATFAENLVAEVYDARINNLNFIIEKNNAEVKNSVRKICEDFGITEKTAAKPFDGAPLPDKNGLITTVNNLVFPICNLEALYIDDIKVRAVYNANDEVLHGFDDISDAQDYFNELVSRSNLTKVDDDFYADKDAVKDVIVERNGNRFDIKIVIGDEKFFIDYHFNVDAAFDFVDELKSKFGIE